MFAPHRVFEAGSGPPLRKRAAFEMAGPPLTRDTASKALDVCKLRRMRIRNFDYSSFGVDYKY
jgi:hypothetical protein